MMARCWSSAGRWGLRGWWSGLSAAVVPVPYLVLYAPYFERGADLHIMRKSQPIHRSPKYGAFASPYDLHTV
jgi:hypothetical protein